jgi:release factor glutamine methyltransferase
MPRTIRVRKATPRPGMLTYREALIRATDQLSAHPDLRPTAFPDATLLFTHAIAITRSTLMAHPDRCIDRDQQAIYQRLLERRLRFEPMQYILGETEFYGLPFRVTPAVLIPRPETELLVETVGERLGKQDQLHIADIGTGSGAIAIALSHLLPLAYVTATDLSSQALEVARTNAVTNRVADRIQFMESDLLSAIPASELFDCIVSNPPYIPQGDAPTLHPQVRDHEPAQALFAGDSGMDIYERLIPQSHDYLKPNGLLALEIGYGQRDAIAALLSGWRKVEFLLDLQQIPRVALARRS